VSEILKVSKISKSYSNLRVLDSIDLVLNSKETLTLAGKNGAGKTTLLNILAGLLKPDSGKVNYGFNENNKIGFSTENPLLWTNLTVEEHINTILALYKTEIKKTDTSLYKELGLHKYKNIYAQNLSNGNKKKLNFLLSVVHRPHLLLLDEPFSFLDEDSVEVIKSYILEFSKLGDNGVVLATNRGDIKDFFNSKTFFLTGMQDV